ncbi:hypothetical protein PU42_25605, partial [Escherichia coli]
ADAGIQNGLRNVMAVLQSKSPGRRLPALDLDFRIINVVTRPAGLNIVGQHRFLRPVTMQYPAQLHTQILTLATVLVILNRTSYRLMVIV